MSEVFFVFRGSKGGGEKGGYYFSKGLSLGKKEVREEFLKVFGRSEDDKYNF